MEKDIYILGIESSCDDTSAAVLKNGVLLSNVTASQAVHEYNSSTFFCWFKHYSCTTKTSYKFMWYCSANYRNFN